MIDPVANHIGDRNSNSDAEVRNAIAPLNKLADDLDCLLIGVRHPGKDRTRGALASILGSTAWVDTPRAVVMIAVDDEDDAVRHIQVVAGNRSLQRRPRKRSASTPSRSPGSTEPITLAVELGESSKSVDDLLEGRRRRGPLRSARYSSRTPSSERSRAGGRMREYLNVVCGEELGASPDTIYRQGIEPLRKDERIKARKDGLTAGWSYDLS